MTLAPERTRERPTPDEVTARAEEYILTGLESCYATLEGSDRTEFWEEVVKIKARRGLGAWRRT